VYPSAKKHQDTIATSVSTCRTEVSGDPNVSDFTLENREL